MQAKMRAAFSTRFNISLYRCTFDKKSKIFNFHFIFSLFYTYWFEISWRTYYFCDLSIIKKPLYTIIIINIQLNITKHYIELFNIEFFNKTSVLINIYNISTFLSWSTRQTNILKTNFLNNKTLILELPRNLSLFISCIVS